MPDYPPSIVGPDLSAWLPPEGPVSSRWSKFGVGVFWANYSFLRHGAVIWEPPTPADFTGPDWPDCLLGSAAEGEAFERAAEAAAPDAVAEIEKPDASAPFGYEVETTVLPTGSRLHIRFAKDAPDE